MDVKSSAARPHFRGQCIVRQGSTNKTATEAEIAILRSAAGNPKVRQLLAWIQEGQTSLTCEQVPTGYWGTVVAEVVEVKETYIVLRYTQNFSLTVPIEDLRTGYDHQKKRPKVSFPEEPLNPLLSCLCPSRLLCSYDPCQSLWANLPALRLGGAGNF